MPKPHNWTLSDRTNDLNNPKNKKPKSHEKPADKHELKPEQKSPPFHSNRHTSHWFDLDFRPNCEEKRTCDGDTLAIGVEKLRIGYCWQKRRKDYDSSLLNTRVDDVGDFELLDTRDEASRCSIFLGAKYLAAGGNNSELKNLERDSIWIHMFNHRDCQMKIESKRWFARRRFLIAKLKRLLAKIGRRQDIEAETGKSAKNPAHGSVFRKLRLNLATWMPKIRLFRRSRSRRKARYLKGARKHPPSPVSLTPWQSPDHWEKVHSTRSSGSDENSKCSQQSGSSLDIVKRSSSPRAANQEKPPFVTKGRVSREGRYIPPHKRGEAFGEDNVRGEETRKKSFDANTAKITPNVALKQKTSRSLLEGNDESTVPEWRRASEPPMTTPEKYRPGFIAWVPTFDGMNSDSILHSHEDFGRDGDGTPRGAYGHPALVYEADENDEKRCICLKITSWSATQERHGKWKLTEGAQERRALYVPLTGTNPELKKIATNLHMPILTFEDGQNMPPRNKGGKKKPNESHVNVERIFLVEKNLLEDFKSDVEIQNLYLTKESLDKIRCYRASKNKPGLDAVTVCRQREKHQESIIDRRTRRPALSKEKWR